MNDTAKSSTPPERERFIVCRNSQGADVRGSLARFTRYLAVFEVYNPYSIVQLSEVLSDFKIFISDRLVYHGRAVVSNLVNTGVMLLCEATLDEAWLDVDIFAPINQPERLREELASFWQEWEKINQLDTNFKVMVADMQTMLTDLQRWVQQVELGIRSQPSGNRIQIEREVIENLKEPLFPLFQPIFEKFEESCREIAPNLRSYHEMYVKRQLVPIVSCAPFFYRAYSKPLGYAGDYEMVNMMLRDPLEGSTLFAKMLNLFFLKTAPVKAHQNRITYLRDQLHHEIASRLPSGGQTRILNLGCGPALEIQEMLAEDSVVDSADFTLLDFNEETLQFAHKTLEDLRKRHRRDTSFRLLKRSVHQLLKDASKPSGGMPLSQYDFIYCAGLFDYLSDRICKRLTEIFYDLLAPGGLLVATNVDKSNPSRNWMEYVVEWHLTYRDKRQLQALVPKKAERDLVEITQEPLGVNIFIQLRKRNGG